MRGYCQRMTTLVYFGPRWDTPAIEGTLEVDTPVGRPCGSCQEPIVRGDRGFVELIDMQDNDPSTGKVTHLHAECRLDDLVGHLIGVCACRFLPIGRDRARQTWIHFYDEEGRSLWPQSATR